MRLPDFLCIGTQKGGTTYLYELLRCHPEIFLASPKEQHFFSLYWQKGTNWYANQFLAVSDNQICGEVTPYYLYHPEAPRRIFSVVPEVKLIVLLRDPVERALSQYFHSRRLGFEPLELEAAFDAESDRLSLSTSTLAEGKSHLSHQQHSYISRSRYEEQLDRYFELFAPSQMIILRSEELFSSPDHSWQTLTSFLEVRSYSCPFYSPVYAGKGESESVSFSFKSALRERLASTYEWMDANL